MNYLTKISKDMQELQELRRKLESERNKNQLLQSQLKAVNQDMARLVEAFENIRSERNDLRRKSKPESPKMSCNY